MFMISRSLKATLPIVGFLVVSLGLIVAFQPEEAEATHSSISCLIKKHRVLGRPSITVTGSSYTGKTRNKDTTCSDCYGLPPRRHKQRQKIIYFDYKIDYEHASWGSSSWSFCHTHSGSSSKEQWVTVRCRLGEDTALERRTEENYPTIRRRFI